MTKCNLGMLILSVSLCFTVAFLGQLAMPNPKTNLWFQGLIKPSFYPPDWVFGPVWSVLYLMMGVALWLVWRQKEHTSIRWPVVAFFVQLAANGAWTPLFFWLATTSLGIAGHRLFMGYDSMDTHSILSSQPWCRLFIATLFSLGKLRCRPQWIFGHAQWVFIKPMQVH